MIRTTITLPDDLAALVDEERRRTDDSTSGVVRRALHEHFGVGRRRKLAFAALGRSGKRDTARRAEEILATEWDVLAIVDTGPLYASIDEDDDDHATSVEALQDPAHTLVIPALVVAETTYLVATRLGARVEAKFLTSLRGYDVRGPVPEDWSRIGALVERYASASLGGTDASVIALAERLSAEVVITLDRKHFEMVRPRHVRAFRLLPERRS